VVVVLLLLPVVLPLEVPLLRRPRQRRKKRVRRTMHRK
jgi:hypothetical protein